jgi:hypothetical protein
LGNSYVGHLYLKGVVIAGQLAVLAYLQISEPSLGAILSTRSRNASLLPKTPSPPRTG